MNNKPQSFEELQEVMNQTMVFPTLYQFKFIVPKDEVPTLLNYLEGMNPKETPSKNGNYISVSALSHFQTSDEIIAVYKKVSVIKGIISL